MALSTGIWIIVLVLLALLIARATGNFYDDYVGSPIPRSWPGFWTFWWRKLRRRCQYCAGSLKSKHSPTAMIIEHEGRKYKICHWCVKLARHAQNYGMGQG